MLARLLCALALASAAAAPEAPCPVKVLGAGFGRTGTYSLKTALETLGLRSYHMDEVLSTGWAHIKAWDDHVHGVEPLDFDAILDGYDAAVDFPVGATQI
ncbi:proteasome-activating ATPase [Aureococcus anophagefferens]|nr:proteasome-activating ATPase [Aureococcus anophagefferens]